MTSRAVARSSLLGSGSSLSLFMNRYANHSKSALSSINNLCSACFFDGSGWKYTGNTIFLTRVRAQSCRVGVFVEKISWDTGLVSIHRFSQCDLIIASNFLSVIDDMSSKTRGYSVPMLLARSRVIGLKSLPVSGVTGSPARSFNANWRKVVLPFDDLPKNIKNNGPRRSTRPKRALRIFISSWKNGEART